MVALPFADAVPALFSLGQSLGDDDSDQEQDSPASGSGASGSSSAASTSASAGPRPFPPVPPGEHRLQSMYCLWFSRKTGGKQAQAAFDQQLRKIGTFATCEQFWELYSHLISPGELQSHSDFHLFKEGIKPMWEVRTCTYYANEHAENRLLIRSYERMVLLCRMRPTGLAGSGSCGYAKVWRPGAGRT